VAVGAGVSDPRRVNSPTFVIVNEYEAGPAGSSLRLYHIDAYRLRGGADLEALGFDEMVSLGTVLIEWADRVPEALPADRLTIVIEPLEEHQRRFTCDAGGPAAQELLRQFRTADGLSGAA
jgi:tRNA threonylcarbamoyladenosine biosynthesis protein TsaE